ncbi:hypothetical protein HYALB_00002173 [Hymenoscyphus albidus]|uniref:Uncharacterized protein n=1 Tax=Hymenoscyphus albidus TaxID=595503 RepID=A0A9N9LQB5_9HELO|nr:hypothetical protein HYALB_00002173 [Hymenoscyphus albidus]
MPPKRTNKVPIFAKEPVVTIQKAFNTLSQHLRDSGEEDEHNKVISLPNAAVGVRKLLAAHRRKNTSIEGEYVDDLVSALDDGHEDTSLHKDNLSDERERVKKRKEAIGSQCLNLLFGNFVDTDGPPELRKWLLKGCESNLDLLGVGPDRTREGLGQMLKTEENEIVRCLAGKVIDIIRSSGTVALQTLWPKGTSSESIQKFPRSSQDGWSQKFQDYIDETANEKRTPTQMLYFATDCYLKPDFELGCSGHSLIVTVDFDFLTVHVSSSDQLHDRILQIPIPSISDIAIRDEAETQNGFSAIYILIGVGLLCTLNGKKTDVSSVRLRGPPDFAETLMADVAGVTTFNGKVNDTMDCTEFDTDDTNSHIPPMGRSTQEELMIGSEIDSVDINSHIPPMGRSTQEGLMIGSDIDSVDINSHIPPMRTSTQEEPMIGSDIESVNINSHEQMTNVDGDSIEEDLYHAPPQNTQITRSPKEPKERRGVPVAKNNDGARLDRQEVAVPSQSQGPTKFSKRGLFPSKPQDRAEEPAAVSNTMLAAKSKPKTDMQGKVASRAKNSDAVGKGKPPAKYPGHDVIEDRAVASNAKPGAKSVVNLKLSKRAQLKADVDNKFPNTKSQPAPIRRKSVTKTKSKAKAPITQPVSKTRQSQPQVENEAAKLGGVPSPAIDSVDFDISDEHNFSTPKTFQQVKLPHQKNGSSHAHAERSQGQMQKMNSKVLIGSKDNAQQDEYDLPTASDDEDSVISSIRNRPKNPKSKRGVVKYQGAEKTKAKKALSQKKVSPQGKLSSKSKSATGGMREKASTTKSSQLRNLDGEKELQAPPPRKNPPRSSQVAKESSNLPKIPRASKIPVPSSKHEKSPVPQSEAPDNVENEHQGKKSARAKRKTRGVIAKWAEDDHELPLAEVEGGDYATQVSPAPPLQEAGKPGVPRELVSFEQVEREITEKNSKPTNKGHAKKAAAGNLSLPIPPLDDNAHSEDSPEAKGGSQAEKVVDEDSEEPFGDPMNGFEDQGAVGETPEAPMNDDIISPMKSNMGDGTFDSQESRKRKAEVEETTPSKKRRSLTQEKVRNVSPLQNLDSQAQNKKSNNSAPEHQFKKPAVPGRLEADMQAKLHPESQAKPAAFRKASPFNESANTPAANERRLPVAATGEDNASALVDDSAHRKAQIIAFDKNGPINQGRASATPKPQAGSVPQASLQRENPSTKRKLDIVEISGVESPPSKKRQSSLAQRDDDGMADVNFDDASARSSSPAPTSLVVATKVTRKRPITKPSSQASRVDLNGSPMPLNLSVFNDNIGIDEKIRKLSQPKHQDMSISPQSFKPEGIFGPKARIGSQNKARPSSPEKVELRYIPHQKTKNGNYQGIVGREVVEPQILADPFVEQPPAHKSSGFTERLRTESSTKAGKTGALPVAEKIQSIPRPRGARISKTKLGSKRTQVYVDDPEKTLVEGAVHPTLEISVPSMCSDNSNSRLSSDLVRSPLQDVSGNETWNVALRPHYTNLKDAVHRVADEMIIRLASEEDRMDLLVQQYQDGGAKIVDNLVEQRTQEKKKIAEGLSVKKSAMAKAYKASGRAIAKVVASTKKNSVAQFTEGWKAKQAAIREKIRKGREGV